MAELNLKPCPFCGGEFSYTRHEERIGELRTMGVCKTCGMRFDYTQDLAFSNAALVALTESFEQLWNRRSCEKCKKMVGAIKALERNVRNNRRMVIVKRPHAQNKDTNMAYFVQQIREGLEHIYNEQS